MKIKGGNAYKALEQCLARGKLTIKSAVNSGGHGVEKKMSTRSLRSIGPSDEFCHYDSFQDINGKYNFAGALTWSLNVWQQLSCAK